MTDILKQLVELHEQERAMLAQLRSVRHQIESKPRAANSEFWDETIGAQHGRLRSKLGRIDWFRFSLEQLQQIDKFIDEVKE